MADGPLSDVVRGLRKLSDPAQVAELSGEELLLRFAATGDEPAFAEVLRRHGPAVLRLCRQVVGHEQDAEDVFQAAFLVLARKAHTIRRPGALAGWLYRTAGRLAVEAREQSRRRLAREKAVARPEAGHPRRGIDDEVGPLLHEAVARLPSRYRSVVVMCYLEGRSNAEAARELNWPIGTVKVRSTRARNLLRDWLSRRGVTLSDALLAPVSLAVPASLADPLVRHAPAFARGEVVGPSASVLSLTRGALRLMWFDPLKRLTAALLVLGLLGAGAAYALWPAATGPKRDLVRSPLPAKAGPAALFPGESVALPVAARGRVVFSSDGKRLAWLAGGRIHVADTRRLVAAGKGGLKLSGVGAGAAKQEYLDAVFLPGPNGPLAAVTAAGLKAVGPDEKANKAAAVDLEDTRPVALSPDGRWLAAASESDLRLLRVGGKEKDRKTLPGVSFGAWGGDGSSALVVGKDLDVRRVDLASGKSTTVVKGADLAKLCGVKLGRVEVRAVSGKGAGEKLFLAAREAEPTKAYFSGVHVYPVPRGAEKRGRNNGSAEPGSDPPWWAVLHAGGRSTVLSANWTARWCDSIVVLPSGKLDRFLYAQMAQKGWAMAARDPEVWLGTIDAKGKKTETKLAKSPFPPQMRDIRWHVLDWKEDASRALVLVTAHLEVRKAMKGPDDIADLTVRYNRAAQPSGNDAVLLFQSWSLWVFDAEKGTLKQLSKRYAEKIDELAKSTVGLEGKLLTTLSHRLDEHVAYSHRAGVVALSLNKQSLFSLDEEALAPLVLLRVPEW
jgi:RNA polymerase sigma factor (sigma-70 family)